MVPPVLRLATVSVGSRRRQTIKLQRTHVKQLRLDRDVRLTGVDRAARVPPRD